MNPFYRSNYRQSRKSWGTEFTHAVSDFSGGLNNKYLPSAIADKEVCDSRNLFWADGVLLEKRNGFKQYNMSRYLAPIRHVGRWERLGATVIVSGSRAYIDYDNGTSTAILPWNAGATTLEYGDTCSGVEFQGRYWLADEYRLIMIKEDLQCFVVENAPQTKVTDYAGTIIDEQKCLDWITLDLYMTINQFGQRYGTPYTVGTNTYYQGNFFFMGTTIGQEENVRASWTTQPNSTTHNYRVKTVLTNTIKLEAFEGTATVIGEEFILNAPLYLYEPLDENYVEGVVHWNDTGTPMTVSYLPCVQELADAYAGWSYLPANPTMLEVHKNRLCVIGDDTQKNCVFMSRTSNPLYFPTSTAFITPDPQPLNNMFVFDGALVVGSKQNIYAIYGSSEGYSTNNQFSMKRMDVTTGFMCQNCGDIIQNYYLFLGADKRFHLLSTPTTNVEYLMVKDAGDKIDLEKAPFEFGLFNECEVQAVSVADNVYFNISTTGTNAWNCIVVYNYTLMAYTYFTGFNAVSIMKKDNDLLFANSEHKVFKYEPYVTESERQFKDATATDGTYNAIKAKLKTKVYQPYGNVREKYFKQITATTHIYENVASNITVNIIIDETVIPVSTIRSSLPGFGNAWFNVAHYFQSIDRQWHSKWRNLDKRGLTIQYEFKNENLNEGMKVQSITSVYKAKDIR